MTTSEINPWSSSITIEKERLFRDFGIEPIDQIAQRLTHPPSFIKRGIVIGHRDYQEIVDAIQKRSPFTILTGFMPSGHPHLGHLMVMKEVVWHIQQGGSGYVAIADREAYAVRGISWEMGRRFGREYLACLSALGFVGQTYFQSQNERLKDFAFEAGTRVNFSDLAAIYGFTQETDLGHAESVMTQVADILYPQLVNGPAPTLVPVGIDQDPHIRLTRGVAHKFRMFTIEERGDLISVRSKNAPEEAFNAVKSAFSESKVYEGHIDISGVSYSEVASRVRAIERSCGGYAFVTPSSIYHSFMPGLHGGKMSSSIPDSFISFFEPDSIVEKKVMHGITGGRMTRDEQRRYGGDPEICSIFSLNLFHMVLDDRELDEIRKRCLSGEMTCRVCKSETASRVITFLSEFREKIKIAEDEIQV